MPHPREYGEPDITTNQMNVQSAGCMYVQCNNCCVQLDGIPSNTARVIMAQQVSKLCDVSAP